MPEQTIDKCVLIIVPKLPYVRFPVGLDEIEHELEPDVPPLPSLLVQSRAVEGPSNHVPKVFCSV